MGLLKWFTQPAVDIVEQIIGSNDNQDPKKVSPLTPDQPVQQFNPLSFDSYIGQERTKNILKSYIQGVRQRDRIFPHVIISGSAGCGKTALARILAKELDVPFVEMMTGDIGDSFDVELKIEEAEGGILFLDEVHGVQRGVVEGIYTMMQDFLHEGMPIKPFTLIGATTELGEIIKTRKPFYDRFKIPIELDEYTPKELSLIAKQYRENTFLQDILPGEVYDVIGHNCRKTPRIAIKLVEATVYLNGNINQTLRNFSIIKDGFTDKDLYILKYIAENEKGVGLQGIGSFLGTSPDNYLYQIEPFLLQNGLILRTSRGRTISERGKLKITELENG